MNYLNKKKMKNTYKTMNSWFFAITVAILIYALLLLLFTSAKIKVQNSTANEPQIIMLPLDGHNNLAQKQLLYWLKDDNPTLIVQPNNKYGYSSILNPNFNFSLNDYSIDINSMLSPLYFFSIPFRIQPIAVNNFSLKQLFSRLDLINNPNVPSTSFFNEKIEILNYPYIKEYYSGKLIPVKFNNREEIQKLIVKDNPQKPTVLFVTIPSNHLFFPIVDVISSCGSPELDKEAMNNLITANLSNKKSLQNKQLKVYVEWQQPKEKKK